MRLIQAFLLLALLPVRLFAQTETPENLTEGVLAFNCVSENEEITLVLLDEQSEWRLLGTLEGYNVTEIDDGFRFERSGEVGWLSYLQQDRQGGWNLRYLDEDSSDSFVCVDENELLMELAEAIVSKVLENGEMLVARTFILEQELASVTSALADEQLKSSMLEENGELLAAQTSALRQELALVKSSLADERLASSRLMEDLEIARGTFEGRKLELARLADSGDASSINAFLDEVLLMDRTERSQVISQSLPKSGDIPLGSLRVCLISLELSNARFDDECRAEVTEYLLTAN